MIINLYEWAFTFVFTCIFPFHHRRHPLFCARCYFVACNSSCKRHKFHLEAHKNTPEKRDNFSVSFSQCHTSCENFTSEECAHPADKSSSLGVWIFHVLLRLKSHFNSVAKDQKHNIFSHVLQQHASRKISFPFTNSLQLARERKELWRKKINKYEMQPPHAPARRMKVLIQISLSWSGFPTTQCTWTNSYEYERGNLGVVELSISHSHVKALAQHQQQQTEFSPKSNEKVFPNCVWFSLRRCRLRSAYQHLASTRCCCCLLVSSTTSQKRPTTTTTTPVEKSHSFIQEYPAAAVRMTMCVHSERNFLVIEFWMAGGAAEGGRGRGTAAEKNESEKNSRCTRSTYREAARDVSVLSTFSHRRRYRHIRFVLCSLVSIFQVFAGQCSHACMKQSKKGKEKFRWKFSLPFILIMLFQGSLLSRFHIIYAISY